MIELGQLEEHHADFEKKHARVVVVSLDELEYARKTQERFPDLVILADPDAKLISAVKGIHPKAGPHGSDTAAPTTIILDGTGKVRWYKRPERVIARPEPDEVLAALDKTLGN